MTIRIGTALVEIASGRIISTTACNGSVPGPVIRLREGRPVTVEVINDADETIPRVFRMVPGLRGSFDRWTINGRMSEESTPSPIRAGRRYRLAFDNQGPDRHPLHLHRHSFELVDVGGQRTAGVLKDVVAVRKGERIDVDFVADSPGLTLFHCHQQLHMDYGFVRLLRYA